MSSDISVNSVFQFLDEISSNVSKESSGLEDAVVLKEGWVFIRSLARVNGKETGEKVIFLPPEAVNHGCKVWRGSQKTEIPQKLST